VGLRNCQVELWVFGVLKYICEFLEFSSTFVNLWICEVDLWVCGILKCICGSVELLEL